MTATIDHLEVLQQRISAIMPPNSSAKVSPLAHPETGEIYIDFEVGNYDHPPWYSGRDRISPDASDQALRDFVEGVQLNLVAPKNHPETIALSTLI